MTAGAARWLPATPAVTGPGIGRRAAQQLARHELARSIYAESISTRILRWLARLLSRVLDAGNSLPGGLWSTIAMVVALILVIASVTYWIRPAVGRRGKTGALLSGTAVSSRDHRELAGRHAANGDYSAAIIERMRAVAVGMEERGLLAARPGRTADELASEASQAMSELASDLVAAARLFDDVRYGGRTGTRSGYDHIAKLDAEVQAARPAVLDAPPRTAAALGGRL